MLVIHLVTTLDLINDNYNRNAKSFQDKEDSERYAITLPIVKGKITFPVSLSKGQNVYNLLVQLMHDQRAIRNFSKLPIPFYCIATDLNNGEMVLLKIVGTASYPVTFEIHKKHLCAKNISIKSLLNLEKG